MNKPLLISLIAGCLTVSVAQAQVPAPTGTSVSGVATPGTAVSAPSNTDAQPVPPRGNGRIAGVLLDSATNQPVEFATVALLNVQTGKPVDGTTADGNGQFALTKVAAGTYTLRVSFLGYKNKDVPNLVVARGADINVGVLRLSADVQTLNEVEVTAQRALVEEKVDRLVYNAEKDLTSKGGDATDILRKVPMLTVDLDGNVSLRGSSNIRVLINNKPSTIVASSVADALKQLPADMIKTVEVITSPSAKYDAEGSGGIINIVTKKNTLQGLTLNVDGGVGNRASNLGLNGAYRQGKFGVTLGGFGRAFYNPATLSLDQTTERNGDLLRTSQFSDSKDRGLFGQYTFGFDYDIAKNQSLTAGVRLGVRNLNRDQYQTTNLFTNERLTATSFRDVVTQDRSNSVDVNVDYLRTFRKPQQEWSISTQYSRTNLTNNFTADLLSGAGELIGQQANLNGNVNQETTLQTDYQTPIRKNQLLEFGAKGIFRQVNSDYSYLGIAAPSGALDYGQNIGAGYVSYTLSTKNKYTLKIGSRYEHTAIDARTRESGPIAMPDYSNLVPSLNVSKALTPTTTLKAGYNRRIQRPGLQQLNPNVNAANPQNITIGNPNLRPELTDNAELALSTSLGKTYLNVSLFGRQTNNAITQVRQASDTLAGAIVTTFENIGRQQAVGTNVFANVTITPKWTLSGGIDLFYSHLTGLTTNPDGRAVSVSNAGLNLSGRLMSQVQLTHGWGVQAFGFSRGTSVQLQGRQGGFFMYSLGVRKEFKNKLGSLGLAGENFLTSGVRMRSQFTSPGFTQLSDMHLLNQGIKLTFAYKIGKMNVDAPRRKTRSVANDDVKSDGGNEAPAASSGGRPR